MRMRGLWRSSRPTGAPRAESAQAAAVVLRLAVLLRAGVAPDSAWRHLADGGSSVASAVVHARAEGLTLADAIARRGGPWRDLAAAWSVATEVGAPLARSLRSVAAVLRESAEVEHDVTVALAEPASSARLMLWLPVVGALLGVALGFDTVAVLFRQPAGVGLLVTGVLLVLAARRWTSRLVRAARPAPGIPGLFAELTAIAVSGGVSIDRARTLVAAHDVPADDVEEVLRLSSAAGVPAAELLRAHAEQCRLDARTAARVAAARLSTRLLLPLGVCTLPAFLCLGVAPLMLSVLTSNPL